MNHSIFWHESVYKYVVGSTLLAAHGELCTWADEVEARDQDADSAPKADAKPLTDIEATTTAADLGIPSLGALQGVAATVGKKACIAFPHLPSWYHSHPRLI